MKKNEKVKLQPMLTSGSLQQHRLRMVAMDDLKAFSKELSFSETTRPIEATSL